VAGAQSLPSGRHIPDAQGTPLLSLQFPAPSQTGLISVLLWQIPTPQIVFSG
jgi:hypothetical protein